MTLLLPLPSLVIWSLIWISTTQWASETHSFWGVMPMVGETVNNTLVFMAFVTWTEDGKMPSFEPAVYVSSLSADLRIRPMILVVKKWARHHQINDASKGTLSSYTLVLMVLHYLQSQYNHTHADQIFFHSHLYFWLIVNLNLYVLFSLQLSTNLSFPLYRGITQ